MSAPWRSPIQVWPCLASKNWQGRPCAWAIQVRFFCFVFLTFQGNGVWLETGMLTYGQYFWNLLGLCQEVSGHSVHLMGALPLGAEVSSHMLLSGLCYCCLFPPNLLDVCGVGSGVSGQWVDLWLLTEASSDTIAWLVGVSGQLLWSLICLLWALFFLPVECP